LSRPDAKTGLVALSPSEVEKLNLWGEGATVVDFHQFPRLHGFVAVAAERCPFRDPFTGESAGTRLEMFLQTPHGLMLLRSEHEALGSLYEARVGAPFKVSMARDGTFEVLVGDPVEDDPPPPEFPAAWKAEPIPDLGRTQEEADRAIAERELLARAVAVLRGGVTKPN